MRLARIGIGWAGLLRARTRGLRLHRSRYGHYSGRYSGVRNRRMATRRVRCGCIQRLNKSFLHPFVRSHRSVPGPASYSSYFLLDHSNRPAIALWGRKPLRVLPALNSPPAISN